jgi:hypothetical protein
MSDDTESPEVLSPACIYHRQTFADTFFTEHDLTYVARHMRECASCEKFIGREINQQDKNTQAAELPGT